MTFSWVVVSLYLQQAVSVDHSLLRLLLENRVEDHHAFAAVVAVVAVLSPPPSAAFVLLVS